MKKYRHLLKEPKKDVIASEQLMRDLLDKRISKIEYSLEAARADSIERLTSVGAPQLPHRLLFNQGSQTQIDTGTFLDILRLNGRFSKQ